MTPPRLMPLMMVIFLLLASIQIALSLHLSVHSIAHVLQWGASLWPALAAGGLALSVAGLLFETRAEKISRKGLLRRRGFIMDVLARLTNRAALEDMLAREQRETTLDAEELAANLRARVIGQDQVCEDMAQQLRRRLALQVRGKPRFIRQKWRMTTLKGE